MRDLIGDAENLGEADEMDVIDRLVSVAGLNVVDVGCGGGRITRQLAERGALVLGVEPDPIQAEKNRAAEAMPGLSFVEAPGQALPVDDDFMDGVFFSYSLHHVPREHMDGALAEAARVLKPETGFLYVQEPMLAGSMEAVYRPFHDETEVRTLAYAALRRVAAPRFAEARELRYREFVRYDSFATFVEEVAGTTYSEAGPCPRSEWAWSSARAAWSVISALDTPRAPDEPKNAWRGPARARRRKYRATARTRIAIGPRAGPFCP